MASIFSDPKLAICRTPIELAYELASVLRPVNTAFADYDPIHDPMIGSNIEQNYGIVIANDLRAVTRPRGSRGRVIALRSWSQIVGITLHQTATRDFPADHSALSEVPAHAMVHRDGRVSLLHNARSYVQHGHALNAGTIGIEIACRAAGTEGVESTFWRSKAERDGWKRNKLGVKTKYVGPKSYDELVAEATDAQLQATRLLCGYFIDLVGENVNGGPGIRGIWGHIQGRNDRTSDPGSRIWKGVAEPVRLQHGLADVRDMTLGTGTPIPQMWRID